MSDSEDERQRRFHHDLRALFTKYRVGGLLIYAKPTHIARCDNCDPPHPVFADGDSGVCIMLPCPADAKAGFAYGYATMQKLYELHQEDRAEEILCEAMRAVHEAHDVPVPKRDRAHDYLDDYTGPTEGFEN